jgi:predicted DNA-binding protein with PD1-like motif
MHVLEVRNTELIESITKQAAELGITDAAIIGVADSFTVSTNRTGDASGHIITSDPLPAEMTATGEIIDGKPHIHAVMAIQGDRAVAGHLHQAQIGTWFAHAYVIPSTHHIALYANERVVLGEVTLP